MVFFDASVITFPAIGNPIAAAPETVEAAIAFLTQISMGAGTCPGAGLNQGLKLANNSASKHNTVVFLTDGFATCPGQIADHYAQAIITDIAAKNFKRLEIHSWVIGSDGEVSESFPKKLALLNFGAFTRIRP